MGKGVSKNLEGLSQDVFMIQGETEHPRMDEPWGEPSPRIGTSHTSLPDASTENSNDTCLLTLYSASLLVPSVEQRDILHKH